MAFEFDRYINGTLMAEGVIIERQKNLADAMREAARIASRGPNGEAPVLVLRAEAAERAIAERAGGVKVPIGYALVPVEPTDRMVSAYVAAKPKGAGFNHPRKGDDKKAWFAAHEKKCRERWKAMLSVSALTTEPAAPEGQQPVAEALELSGNTGELIDKMAEAIRGDTASDDTPWATLSEDRKIGWRGDAERALAVVKEYLTARRPAPEGHHPDDIAVDRFAAAMKEKLARKREEGRGGWDDKEKCSGEYLSRLLREHVDKGDPVDVGNLAMMLHQRGERIAPEGQQDDDRIRCEMDEILRRQSERDIPFAPATRPAEQAVTEAAFRVCTSAKLVDINGNGALNYVVAPYLIDALKAAMEAGR